MNTLLFIVTVAVLALALGGMHAVLGRVVWALFGVPIATVTRCHTVLGGARRHTALAFNPA